MGKTYRRMGTLITRGFFSDHKSSSESRLLKKVFSLQKEVNKAEKNCVFGSRMKGRRTRKKRMGGVIRKWV